MMSERERWVVYPLLLLCLGGSFYNRVIPPKKLTCGVLECQGLTVMGPNKQVLLQAPIEARDGKWVPGVATAQLNSQQVNTNFLHCKGVFVMDKNNQLVAFTGGDLDQGGHLVIYRSNAVELHAIEDLPGYARLKQNAPVVQQKQEEAAPETETADATAEENTPPAEDDLPPGEPLNEESADSAPEKAPASETDSETEAAN